MAEKQSYEPLYDQIRTSLIVIPPWRKRREDIPLPAQYFVRRFAQRMNNHMTTIPAETMYALQKFDWPGNVRQLENFLERSVILTDGSTLRARLSEL